VRAEQFSDIRLQTRIAAASLGEESLPLFADRLKLCLVEDLQKSIAMLIGFRIHSWETCLIVGAPARDVAMRIVPVISTANRACVWESGIDRRSDATLYCRTNMRVCLIVFATVPPEAVTASWLPVMYSSSIRRLRMIAVPVTVLPPGRSRENSPEFRM
jgi:hypothetical protein